MEKQATAASTNTAARTSRKRTARASNAPSQSEPQPPPASHKRHVKSLFECYLVEPRFPASPLEKNGRGEPVVTFFDVAVCYSDTPGGAPHVWLGEISNRTSGAGKEYVAARTLRTLEKRFHFPALDGLEAFEKRFRTDTAGNIVVALP